MSSQFAAKKKQAADVDAGRAAAEEAEALRAAVSEWQQRVSAIQRERDDEVR